MSRSLSEVEREIALSFLQKDARNAYDKWRMACLFLPAESRESLSLMKKQLERFYGRDLLDLQVRAYLTRDLKAVVKRPSPNSPLLGRTTSIFTLRMDLLAVSQRADELMTRELFPELGGRSTPKAKVRL